jgi:hypothetical protein
MDIDLDTVLASVLTEQAATVDAWLRDEPGSWGALAGQAVLAARRALGRRLTETERRIVWQALWDRLGERRATDCPEWSEGSDE